MDPAYLRMRMKLVMSLWPHIQTALASPWSNIRSICYGLVCNMLKISVTDYQPDDASKPNVNTLGVAGQRNSPMSPEFSTEKSHPHHFSNLSYDLNNQNLSGNNQCLSDVMSQNGHSTFSKLREVVLPMLYLLLSSRESESKAGGLNILGSFCGLSYDFTNVKINKHLAFLQRNSKFVSLPIWRLVYNLQDDWDVTIKEASVVLIQLCAPRNAVQYFRSMKDKAKQTKMDYVLKDLANPASIYTDEELATRGSDKQRSEDPMTVKGYLVRKSRQAARALRLFA